MYLFNSELLIFWGFSLCQITPVVFFKQFAFSINSISYMPGFISHLIKKKKHLLAFAHVYDFKLFKSFPPVAILKRHVRYSKMVANRIRKKGRHTHEAQVGFSS